MSSDNSSFQFGLFGYSKKDVELKFDLLREQYESERDVLLNEKFELEKNVEELRKKEIEFNEKNSRFEEVERSVSSIMGVTQRASERVFEEANSQKHQVAEIVSETADQIAGLRQEISDVRNNMNRVIDELQERLNTVDKALVSSVSRLVSVKNDVLNKSSSPLDIKLEVERLLNIAGRDIDITPGFSGSTPSVGQTGANMISESAAKVMNSRHNAYYGLASDRTEDNISELVEQVNYQLAEATADDDMLEKSQGFLNSSEAFESVENDSEENEANDVDSADISVAAEMESNNDYGLLDIEPAESVPISVVFSDPDWFTSSPLISNEKKPKFDSVKTKARVKAVAGDKKVKVKVRKY